MTHEDFDEQVKIEILNLKAFINLARLITYDSIVNNDSAARLTRSTDFLLLCKDYINSSGSIGWTSYAGLVGMTVINANLCELIGSTNDRKALLDLYQRLLISEINVLTYINCIAREETLLNIYNKTSHVEKMREVLKNLKLINENEKNIMKLSDEARAHIALFLRVRAQIKILQLVAAMRVYYLDYNKYPETLNALVPKFISSVPIDPYTGEPLQFDTNRHLIYSGNIKKSDNIEDIMYSGLLQPIIKLDWKPETGPGLDGAEPKCYEPN